MYGSAMTEEQLAELDDPDAPNVPAVLPGHQGPQAIVPVGEQRARRNAMSTALQQAAGTDIILATFAKQFGMTESATRTLIAEVRAMWDDDDAEGARYKKSAQERRLMQHIGKAAKAGKYTAVANLEKTYADVTGTNIHEDDKPVDVDSRLTDALLSVLGVLDTKEVRILISQQKTIIELSALDGTEKVRRLKPGEGETIVEEPAE